MDEEMFTVNDMAVVGKDGTPGWAYDEDGYCTCCGNGHWKYHMPGCYLAAALEKNAEVAEIMHAMAARLDELERPKPADRFSAEWRGSPRAYWDNPGAIHHEIVEELKKAGAFRPISVDQGPIQDDVIESTATEDDEGVAAWLI